MSIDLTDEEREEWVANDEGLYLMAEEWMRSNEGGVEAFVRAHRDTIDALAKGVMDGTRRQHDLVYGP